MKRVMLVALLGFVLVLTMIGSASAQSDPIGGCPNSFDLHMVMPHQDHGHNHVGTDTDLNGDGWVCAKVVGAKGKNHVHINNNLPLPW
jgi:hypothetical protein